MKNHLLIISIFTTSLCLGQEKLNFDTRFTQSEDKWVAFPPDSVGAHTFGFIYIDPQAGLTFDYAGSFKIKSNGKFILTPKGIKSSVKHRLQPNETLVAVIPQSHFKELKITEVPEWLKSYKENENTVERQYQWGYMYNGWGECAKALEFLEKAMKTNPDYTGLRVEMGYSYNCLEKYETAMEILKVAVQSNPNDAYAAKELLYAQIHTNQLDEAIANYERIVKELTDQRYTAENAYNIIGAYYRQKNVEKFNE